MIKEGLSSLERKLWIFVHCFIFFHHHILDRLSTDRPHVVFITIANLRLRRFGDDQRGVSVLADSALRLVVDLTCYTAAGWLAAGHAQWSE